MKRVLLTGILLWAGVSTHGQIKETPKNTAAMDQIRDIHHNLYRHILARDGKKTEAILERDFVFTSANGDVQDKNTFLKAFVLNPAIQLPLLETSDQKIVVIGNTAVLTGLMHVRIVRNVATDSAVRNLWERITETYVQQKGIWTLLALQATYTTSANSDPE